MRYDTNAPTADMSSDRSIISLSLIMWAKKQRSFAIVYLDKFNAKIPMSPNYLLNDFNSKYYYHDNALIF